MLENSITLRPLRAGTSGPDYQLRMSDASGRLSVMSTGAQVRLLCNIEKVVVAVIAGS